MPLSELRPPLAGSVLRIQANPGFAQVDDPATGVRVSLPMRIVSGPYGSQWGNNWRAAGDNRLNIDTLNFRHQRSLSSVYGTLRARKGRRLTNSTYNGSQFILQGYDADGTTFFVQCEDRGGEVRGVSIVYSNWARNELDPVVATMMHSLELFPSYTPPPSAPPPVAQIPTAPPEIADNPEIKRLQEQLKALQDKNQKQEEEARRRQDAQERQAREDAIRQEERRKAQEEALEVEKRLRAEIDRRFDEQQLDARRKTDDDSAGTAQPVGRLPEGKRVAFVVGIDKYKELPPQHQLERAVSDAQLMRLTFEQLGFEVLPVSQNATRREFAVAWQKYLQMIEPGSTAAFFFAGHGVQLSGINYLLPSDVPKLQVNSPELLQLEALDFFKLHSDVLARKPKVSLLILDACRDNPYANQFGRSLGATRGLASVDAVEGSFVLYSAAANEQALDRLPDDGPGENNSVFTRTLAPMMLKSDVTLQEMARRVRREVSDLAGSIGHKQRPAYYDGLTGNVCLSGNCGGVASGAKQEKN